MNLFATRPRLSAEGAEALVRRWHRAITNRVPVEQLTPHLANGLRLDLPTGVLRGIEDFRRWYASGRHLPLAGEAVDLAEIRVSLPSPVHAQVMVTTTAEPGAAPVRQEWWVVRQEGGPRIRTISVHPSATAPATRAAALLGA
ncbi:hypothetical protein RM780_06595 [Streptomyces sp. DSM 44917]|uniref:SnoaL-like domain-containing protein n=1 Tax=Streptomyces boetiae TaxID=3075541 RepID=A0ABU2L4Y9_9ACTN|nr:hypothetical protein [Streptomyces sp. DSM 44917]MDT0306629.1 hypothetical protein [Streptomyces sp. DSM 44917]